jgi:hypothetical protein
LGPVKYPNLFVELPTGTEQKPINSWDDLLVTE